MAFLFYTRCAWPSRLGAVALRPAMACPISTYILPVVTLAAGLLAQTGDNRLTNGEIGSMLMAGLPKSTNEMKIEAAALRGLVDLDSSSNLIALKQKRRH